MSPINKSQKRFRIKRGTNIGGRSVVGGPRTTREKVRCKAERRGSGGRGFHVIMLCSADRTKNGTEGLSLSPRVQRDPTHYARQNGRRRARAALAVPCPSCVNRLDFPFKLSTLFVCPPNCRRRCALWRRQPCLTSERDSERKSGEEGGRREENREIN